MPAEPREPQDPEYITLTEACEVVGGQPKAHQHAKRVPGTRN